MPSRLSSLLVRDGLVGVKRMEKAFQRQVIYGGSLDTILLEMNLIPEERLTQYLALASGLPPAARDEGRRIDPATTAVLRRELAQQYRAVPLALEGETLRVLVCSPLEITELEDLADQLDRPLQPLITPEYRWHLVYATAYGLDPPARFTTLARSLEVDAMVAPVGRAKTIIVEDRSGDVTEKTPMLVAVPSSDPIQMIGDIAGRDRKQTLIGLSAQKSAEVRRIADGMPAPPATPQKVTFVAPQVTPSTGIPRPVPDSGPAKRPSTSARALKQRSVTAPISTEGRDSPLPIVTAREMLTTAEDRDTVFITLLRAARSRARWAGLLTVQGGAAIGRVAIAEPGVDSAAISTVLIPLDARSAFRAVVANHQPHIGPLISGDPSIDSMLLRMGGSMPPSALVLPIVLRNRVVAIVVAHRVLSDLKLEDVTELFPLAHAASEAIGRLIVKHKSAGYRTPEDPSVPEVGIEAVDTKKVKRPDGPWSAPVERPSRPNLEQGIEVSLTADPPRPIDAVLDEIENATESNAEEALTEAVDRAPEALGALNRRFPGKLRVDRFAVAGRPLRASQYGGLLELVIRLGSVSSELLIEKMGDPQRDVRFYASVCATELRPRNAVYALVERLFDQDYGVRSCAIEALSGYPVYDLTNALIRVRKGVHSGDPVVVAAAATALVELGDTESINDLIGIIERTDRAGEHARRALNALTAQDFGASEKKWRKWYDTARNRHRIEWLIEGLSHKEDAIRETAINDLRRLTGEYFGYHHDLPRREREAAAARWVAWWRDAGYRRFVIREDERHRPTALLPVRRE